MLDTFDRERYLILKSKYVKITAPNQGNTLSGIETIGSGVETGTDTVSRATRIVTFFVPGREFTRNRIIQYESQSGQVKILIITSLFMRIAIIALLKPIMSVG